jgi:diguanylate cyclase (GGDEF)-like protein
MVGRFGGEEFLVMLNKCNAGSAAARVVNLRAIVANKPFQTHAKSLELTIRVGIVFSTEFGDQSVDEILAGADAAMYAAKSQAGIACVWRIRQRVRRRVKPRRGRPQLARFRENLGTTVT